VAKFTPCFDFLGNYNCFRRARSFDALPWTKVPDEELEFNHPYRGGPIHSIRKALLPDDAKPTQKEDEVSRRRFTRKGASWRRMLVSQPPPLHIGYLSPDNTDFFERPVYMAMVASTTPTGLCMGQLYDFIQYYAGHHTLHSLWYRLHWISPRGSFYTPINDKLCRELLTKTYVVVEMSEVDDWMRAYHPRSPFDIAKFDTTFRCDEFSAVQVEAEKVAWNYTDRIAWEYERADIMEMDPTDLEANGWI
jgi:hypothetical protein